MGILLAAQRPWNVQMRATVSRGIGQRTSATRLASAFAQGLTAFRGGAIQLAPGVATNPWPRNIEQTLSGVTESVIQLSATLISQSPFETNDVARIFFEALKSAGNPAFSSTRLVNALPSGGLGCGSVDSLTGLRWLTGQDYINTVCIDAAPASRDAASNTAPATTWGDSAVASAGTSTVRDSGVPGEIGLSQRPLGQRLPDGAGSIWDAIPLSYKLGGGAVIGIVALGVLGYAYRSIK